MIRIVSVKYPNVVMRPSISPHGGGRGSPNFVWEGVRFLLRKELLHEVTMETCVLKFPISVPHQVLSMRDLTVVIVK